MYDLGLKEIIKALGIETEERVIDNIVYYGWNDLNMRVDKFLSCLELTGKIPLDFLTYMQKKYPDGTWIESNNIDKKNAIDDIYKRDTDFKEVKRKCEEERKSIDTVYTEAKERLRRRVSKNKYLEEFYTYELNNAVLVLTELKDYYARISGKDESAETDYKTILNQVINNYLVDLKVTKVKNLYKDSNLDITKEEVMQNVEANRKKLEKGYIEFPFLAKDLIQPLLNKFDVAVNPFLRDDVELEKPADYLEKINLIASPSDDFDDKTSKDACILKIESKDEYSKTIYASNGINSKYNVSRYFNEDGSSIFYSHKFVMYPIADDHGTYKDYGEVINFQYSGDSWEKPAIDLHYNISGGYVIINNGEQQEINTDTLLQICEILDKGTALTNEITTANMAKQDSKKLIKK